MCATNKILCVSLPPAIIWKFFANLRRWAQSQVDLFNRHRRTIEILFHIYLLLFTYRECRGNEFLFGWILAASYLLTFYLHDLRFFILVVFTRAVNLSQFRTKFILAHGQNLLLIKEFWSGDQKWHVFFAARIHFQTRLKFNEPCLPQPQAETI